MIQESTSRENLQIHRHQLDNYYYYFFLRGCTMFRCVLYARLRHNVSTFATGYCISLKHRSIYPFLGLPILLFPSTFDWKEASNWSTSFASSSFSHTLRSRLSIASKDAHHAYPCTTHFSIFSHLDKMPTKSKRIRQSFSSHDNNIAVAFRDRTFLAPTFCKSRPRIRNGNG